MKATGIVRRIDDLGRVVIRKRLEEQCGFVREVSAAASVGADNIDTNRQVLYCNT